MEPSVVDIRNLALYMPKFALGMVLGVPRVPFVVNLPISFSSSTVNAPPIVTNFDNNLTQDTLVQRISYSLYQQNSFPGSPFQSLYFDRLKSQTGVGCRLTVYGGPKYTVVDDFIDLATIADVLSIAWPAGWPLFKQSNVKLEAVLLNTPTSVPFDISVTFCGVQMLDKSVDDLSDQEARARLRKLGIESPDLAILLNP